MQIVRFALFAIYIAFAFVGTIILVFFLTLLRSDKRDIFWQFEHFWFRYCFLWPAGIEVECTGLENIDPARPALFVSNHQSALDIMILLAYLPVNISFLSKSGLFFVPMLGWFMQGAGHIKVDRVTIASAYQAMKQVGDHLKSGRSVIIFPEGTRTRSGQMGEFKGGMIHAAVQAGVPVIPMAISGAYEILPAGHLYFQPGKIKLSVGKPIYIREGEDEEVKVKEIRQLIASMLPPRP